ncbi:hypothetical protein B0H17DRAFT_1136846 [Mycena rosella]|uniref:Uncharacterized protein n=1 Tax=Mycena rosella TaxID=1033263 RepID=A0AAD7D9Q3_MYCRO|nr:hypothetical protein B0H17DRAFT_1136846 [Mycena rosella]
MDDDAPKARVQGSRLRTFKTLSRFKTLKASSFKPKWRASSKEGGVGEGRRGRRKESDIEGSWTSSKEGRGADEVVPDENDTRSIPRTANSPKRVHRQHEGLAHQTLPGELPLGVGEGTSSGSGRRDGGSREERAFLRPPTVLRLSYLPTA